MHARFVVPTVASSIDVVVQIGIDADGKRRVREIVAVPGRVEADIIEAEPIFSSDRGRLVRAQGMPPRLDGFAASGIDIHAVLAQPPGQGHRDDDEVRSSRSAGGS
jgi:pilus assembly protein CpaF